MALPFPFFTYHHNIIIKKVEKQQTTCQNIPTKCDHGGTGRRTALRMLWGNPWGFDSPWSHHQDFRYFFQKYTCPEIHKFANILLSE